MSMLVICLIGLLTLLAEATWLHQVAVFGIMPNLSLILVVFWGMLQGSERGRRLGLWMGLLQDFLFCEVIGFYGLVYYLLGHFSGYLKRDFDKRHYILPLAVVSGADFLYGLLHYGIYYFFAGNLNIGFYLKLKILPEMCYTALISLPLYLLLYLLSKGLDRLEGWLKSGKEKEL